MGDSTPPAGFDTATLVDGYDLTFDAGDKRNGSLYLCTPRGGGVAAAPWVATLRAAGLWSADAPKQVADEQRPAYRDGLRFVAARAFAVAGGHVVIARFDHPKFPSDAARWQAWIDAIEASCARDQ